MENNKPWLAHYDAGVPHSIKYPEVCLHDLLIEQATRMPENVAIIHGQRKISYSQLLRLSSDFGKYLVDVGIRPGDRLSICLPNSIGFVIAYYGSLMAGCCVAAMNPAFPKKELEYGIRTASTNHMVTSANRLGEIKEIAKGLSIKQVIVTKETNKGKKQHGYTLDDFFELTTQENHRRVFPVVSPLAPAVLQFTGGTTGVPKAAIGTHKNIVANVYQFRNWLSTLEEGKETFLVAIPLYHVYGMVLGLNLGVLLGARLVFLEDPRNTFEIIETLSLHKVTYFPGVPSMFYAIVKNETVVSKGIDLRHIKACISGSAPLPNQTRLDFESLTGGKLVEGYGLSEAPTATHCNPISGRVKNGSIGIPLPDVDCRIDVIDDPNAQATEGNTGELLIRGPQVMAGYHNNQAETRIALHNGWLHTGDVARMDEDGYFYILGRIKELIKVSGLQVWPMEVEEVLMKIPGVREVAVAGREDPVRGEIVKAWIVLEEGWCLELSDIRKGCKDKLADYKIPSKIALCSSLPRSPIGKILRRELV